MFTVRIVSAAILAENTQGLLVLIFREQNRHTGQTSHAKTDDGDNGH